MSKLVPKLLMGLATLAVIASSAEAGQYAHKKRLGFFEMLFGGMSQPRQNHSLFGSSSNSNRTKLSYNAPAPAASNRAQQTIADRSEPDPLPGLGLGIVNYTPPLLVPVYDSSFLKLTTTSQDAEAIRIELINKATGIRAVDTERKAVLAFYAATSFKPAWTSNGHISPRAEKMLKTMANAAVDGMVPKNYLPAGVTSFDQIDAALGSDPVKLARFDIAMSVATLKFARQMSGGQFDPNRLSLYNDIKPQTVNADAAMRVLGFTPFPEAYVSSLAPSNPQYAVFKDALAKMAGQGKSLDLIAGGADIKPGKTDDRVPAIRARLQGLGVAVPEMDAKADPKLFDKKLANAVRKFQSANRVKATGNVDVATLKALNADHSADERQRLVFNMERLRWLPKNLGSRYVLVNQPAFEVNVFDHDKVAWHSRVIIGKPMNQTYSFYDQIETVVFNPSWGVPASIIINEYGPKSRRDPGYLDRNGFKITDSNGDEISSRDVDWWGMGQAPTFGVQQPPGSDNALGELKFLFPNAHDIYMHDTPTKNLFTESTRAFSHGCVRVQNPREFAGVLLSMSQEEVAKNLGQKAKPNKKTVVTEAFAESHSINLQAKVPVYLTYFTAWTDVDGKIQYYNDIYGRDTAMAKAFAYDPNAKNTNDSGNIVADGTIAGGISQN